jgi:hypothetical protein
MKQPSSQQGWNLFARILRDILVTRGLSLEQLRSRAHVHPQKITRLKESLVYPKAFPILTGEEMEETIEVFAFTKEEQQMLHAAILATSIEQRLMDRINQDDALLAAEEVFPILLKALQEKERGGAHKGLAAVRKGPRNMPNQNKDTVRLERALMLFDRATIALYLSNNAGTQEERVEEAQQANAKFSSALSVLEQVEENTKVTEDWVVWHKEVQKGLASAREYLLQLGE